MDKVITIFLVLIYSVSFCHAQNEAIIFKDKERVLAIGKSISFFKDKTGKLTIKDILRPENNRQFQLSIQEIPNFSLVNGNIWCKFSIQNLSHEECLLELSSAGIHYLELYKPLSANTYESFKMGFLLPFQQRDYQINTYVNRLILPQDTTLHTFYLKIRYDGTILLPLNLITPKKLTEVRHQNDIFYGMYFGLIITSVLLNFFIYLILREKVYLYYVLFVASIGVFNASLNAGFTFEFLWKSLSFLNFYIFIWSAVGALFLIVFTAHFLDTSQNTPILHKGLYVLFFLFIVVIVASLSGFFVFSNNVLKITSFISVLYLLTTGIVAYSKGFKQARFFIIGQGAFLISICLLMGTYINLFPVNAFTNNALIYGSAFEVLFFSFALADKIRSLRLARQKAESEKLQLIEAQNTRLEMLVEERTQEIAAQNEEITAQNEELVQIQEEIAAHRDLLHSQNENIKEAQLYIEEQNRLLEQQVKNRTDDLNQANETLLEYNQQLEQFAFITAHNLRSPVARILGLGNLIELDNNSAEETKLIINQLVSSTQQLDEIIKDLNTILEVNKNTTGNLLTINLSEELNKIERLLDKEIQESHAVISKELGEADKIKSLPPYIHSIFYNLINNAIKYKHPDRNPVIEIKGKKDHDWICISVSDNGLGIDLKNYGSKLFSLYKRFHFHVKGKGLGLYLVKTQVLSLGGKIELESETDKGTTFFIYLPVR